MPPGDQKLSSAEIAVIETWIREGAPHRPNRTDRNQRRDPDHGRGSRLLVLPTDSTTPIPRFAPSDRIRTPIDALLIAALKPKQLAFSPEADRRTLIRRLSLDLFGLPPAPAEVEAFLADTSPDAYERLVDRMLASPHYGERWGRHWLDVAGYADSEGFDDQDVPRPEAFHFRDYVIRAFNANKPFDQFVAEQLAGDELLPPQKGDLTPEAIEKLRATGFLRMAADGTASCQHSGCRQPKHRRHDQDRLDFAPGTVGRLRPVPRPPLRSDSAGRLLPPAGRLRAGTQLEELASPVAATRFALHTGRSSPRRRREPRSVGRRDESGREGAPLRRRSSRKGTVQVRAAGRQRTQNGPRHAGSKAHGRAEPVVEPASERQHLARPLVSIQSDGRCRIAEGSRQSRGHSGPRAGRRLPPRADRKPGRTSADLSLLPWRVRAAATRGRARRPDRLRGRGKAAAPFRVAMPNGRPLAGVWPTRNG